MKNIELVRQIINNDPHSAYDEMIAKTSLPHGTIQRIIHDSLKMKKMTSRWVAHQLSDEQKRDCRKNLAKFRDDSWRLCDIITGDKIRSYHRQIDHKSTQANWLLKMSHQPLLLVKVDLNQTIFYTL